LQNRRRRREQSREKILKNGVKEWKGSAEHMNHESQIHNNPQLEMIPVVGIAG